MAKKEIPPSIKETAFCCPYCGAYTTQHWLNLKANYCTGDKPTPFVPDQAFIDNVTHQMNIPDSEKEAILSFANEINAGEIFIDEAGGYEASKPVNNLFLSECYNCNKVSVWVHDRLVYPFSKGGPEPNQDLPKEIIKDFEEARAILNISPRGSAALLRLCIQKLCIQLGEKGRSIDDDIASLVSKGLNPLIQKSLDIVRVIGNEAVHPGVIDLSDDQDTASKMFVLLNSIADQMITHPKNVNTLWDKIPASKKDAIIKRDNKK
jgi:hypothetical protein